MTSMSEPEEVTPFDGEPEASVKLRQYVADGYDGTLGTAGEAGMRIGGKASEVVQYITTLRTQLAEVTNQCAIWEEEANRCMKAHADEIRKRTTAERERGEARREREALQQEVYQAADLNNGDNGFNASWAYAELYHKEWARANSAEHRAERMERVVEAMRDFVDAAENHMSEDREYQAMKNALCALDATRTGEA